MQRTPVFNRFYLDHMFWDVEANDSIIIRAAFHPITPKTLAATAERVQDDLVIEPTWKAGWHEFIAEYPQYTGTGTYPNMLLAFRSLQPGALPSVENFKEVAHMLAESLEYREQQMENIERKRLIDEISQGKPSYSARNQVGKVIQYKTVDLLTEPIETVRDVHAIVTEQRRLENSTPEEIRAAIKQARTAQGAEEAKDALFNPITGQPFTRKEIVQLIKSGDKKSLRGILFDSDGRIIPERQEAVNNILKGQQ